MQIIRFNGLGEGNVANGAIVLLVQGERVFVARVELLPPEDYGPALEHALNEADLEESAKLSIRQAFPDGLSDEQAWVLLCPEDIARQAHFPQPL